MSTQLECLYLSRVATAYSLRFPLLCLVGEVSYGGDATTLTLVLLSNDAVVSGTLNLNDSPISGVKGDVYAVSGNGGWVETGIDTMAPTA